MQPLPTPKSVTVSSVSTSLRQTFRRFIFIPIPLSIYINEPRKKYKGNKTYAFVDALNRSSEVPLKDCYLSPSHGKLRELVVQASRTSVRANDTTWARKDVEYVSSWTVRLVGDLYQEQNECLYILKWVGTCLGLAFTLLVISDEPSIRWAGDYAPFPYKYHGYPKAARNVLEERKLDEHSRATSAADPQALIGHTPRHARLERRLRPQILNIATKVEDERGNRKLDGYGQPLYSWERTRTQEWRKKNKTHTDPEYLFISYTRDQFPSEDVEKLHQIARKAAWDVGLKAYWSDNCISEERVTDKQIKPDVYRIPDYVRQSAGVAIIRGHLQGEDKKDFSVEALTKMLQDWGKRVWTFPEILLAPGDHIRVYTKGIDDEEEAIEQDEEDEEEAYERYEKNHRIPKTQIADIAWGDSELSGDLINHIRGTIRLSGLELFAIALQSFHSRILHRRDAFQDPEESTDIESDRRRTDGDKIYALAGLLRVRPTADVTDSEFQAFARLSLANDSDQILERLICMLPSPTSPEATWQTLQDNWGVALWDILPTCQISGIGWDDTVIIDGARGASVRWKGFKPVASLKGFSWKRLLARALLRLVPLLFWMGIIFMIAAGVVNANNNKMNSFNSVPDSIVNANTTMSAVLFAIAGTFLAIGTTMLLCFPIIVRKTLSGKEYEHQAWLFGFEGYMSLEQIERHIWYVPSNRLNWAPYGSSLSHHQEIKVVGRTHLCEEASHVEGVDPMSVPNVRDTIAKSQAQGFRVFTLVDTVTMTVFLFLAKRPPIAFLICGQEGGMQRAVGVSYDHTTETVHRETVLRMETTVLERMSRVPRCRIGFGRDESGRWAAELHKAPTGV